VLFYLLMRIYVSRHYWHYWQAFKVDCRLLGPSKHYS